MSANDHARWLLVGAGGLVGSHLHAALAGRSVIATSHRAVVPNTTTHQGHHVTKVTKVTKVNRNVPAHVDNMIHEARTRLNQTVCCASLRFGDLWCPSCQNTPSIEAGEPRFVSHDLSGTTLGHPLAPTHHSADVICADPVPTRRLAMA